MQEYFFGNKVSDEGIRANRVDYATLAKAFNCVLCNDITRLFYTEINGEYNEPELIQGGIDNADKIDDLQEQIDDLQEELDELDEDDAKCYELEQDIEDLENEIADLEEEENELEEIYQYYIISDNGAEILQHYTNEIVYYVPFLDIYIWGVTHFGTMWRGVMTEIILDEEEEKRRTENQNK